MAVLQNGTSTGSNPPAQAHTDIPVAAGNNDPDIPVLTLQYDQETKTKSRYRTPHEDACHSMGERLREQCTQVHSSSTRNFLETQEVLVIKSAAEA